MILKEVFLDKSVNSMNGQASLTLYLWLMGARELRKHSSSYFPYFKFNSQG